MALIHFALVIGCLIAAFPVMRIVAISFRDTHTISSMEQNKVPRQETATVGDYVLFFVNSVLPYPIGQEDTEPEPKAAQNAAPQPTESVEEDNAFADEFGGDFAQFDEDTEDEPHRWYSNYTDLFTEHLFLQWIYNSLVIAFSASFFGVFLAATTAYACSRFEFPGKKISLGFLFTTQMIPAAMMIVPVYLVIKSINLGNTYAGLVLALSVTTLPFSIMVLKGYFDTIPKSLEEAAQIDGCSSAEAFFRILLPLSTPGLAIAFLFNFTSAWSEFLLASTLIDDVELRPWTLGLMEFSGNMDFRWGLFAAGSVVIAVPSIIMFLYTAKYMLSGLTLGGVKG
jgi:arabinogalactan oligomer/maltooligosaccharide transport system permease protein